MGAPPREVVEIRVHGVHGTAPAAMLGVEPGDVRQVAGDNLTGFYRTRSGELPYRALRGRCISVEAYSWGTLTSGVRGLFGWTQRALWLLLLPFALVNLAYWARLELDGASRASRFGARAVRLGALLLTVFLVLVPAYVGIDLVAWQCYRGDSPGCGPLPGLLDFMADLSAGQRLAVSTALPLAFVAILWALSRQSMLRYEMVSSKAEPPGAGPRVLRHAALWNSKERTHQLQRVHLTVALEVVVAFSGVHVARLTDPDGPLLLTSLAAGVLVTGVAAGWALTIHPDDVERPGAPLHLTGVRRSRTGRWVRERLPGTLLLLMCAVTLLHLYALWTLDGDLDQRRDFFGHNLWFIGVFVALTAVHMALFTNERLGWWSPPTVLLVLALAAGAVLAHADKLPGQPAAGWALLAAVLALYAGLAAWQVARRVDRDKAWKGAGASVLLAAAGWVALLYTTAAVTATANWLNGGDHGVEDLVSRIAGDARADQAVSEAAAGAVLAASGDVLVRNAVITLAGSRDPVLRSGVVTSDRLYDVTADTVAGLGGVAVQKGRTRLRTGVLELETATVRIQDSCVRPSDRTPCSPESSRFLAGGLLRVPPPPGPNPDRAGRMRIDSVDGVELDPVSPPAVPLVVPQVLIWAPLAQSAWLLLAASWFGVALVIFRRCRRALDARLLADRIDARDLEECAKARRRAAFAHRVERYLDGLGFITSALVIALIAVSSQGKAPWEYHRLEFLRPFATVGMYVALAMGLGLVLLFSRLRTSHDTRRAVGVLWDLTTFWPRAAHPLAPPSYAERVVPELHRRVDWALHSPPDKPVSRRRESNQVVLSGHSQGSVIVCAVLSRLSDDDLGRVRVITYGSQIRALYGRVFPDVFGPVHIGHEETLGPALLSHAFPDADDLDTEPGEPTVWRLPPDSLAARLEAAGGAWVNLFRRSDPLGFRVFSDHDLDPDRYVPEVPDVVVGDAGPRVNTHGGYQHTLAYRTAVADWTGEHVQPDPEGTTDLPPLPV